MPRTRQVATLLVSLAMLLLAVPAYADPTVPLATPGAAQPVPTIELNVEPIPGGVHVAGEVKLNQALLPAAPVRVAIDGKPQRAVATDQQGAFAVEVMLGDAQPTAHTVSVVVPAGPTWAQATLAQQFSSAPKEAAVLTAAADRTKATAGGTVTVTGTLMLNVDKSPLVGEDVAVGIDNAKAADAVAKVDENGSFTIMIAMPKVTTETDVRLTVHYDGGDDVPATKQDLTIHVVPEPPDTPTPTASASASPATATSPATAPAADVDSTPDPSLPPPPTLMTLWPLILTLGIGLAVLATIAILATRRRQRVDETLEEADTLEAISHGDLNLRDDK